MTDAQPKIGNIPMLSPSQAFIQRVQVDPSIPESLRKLLDIGRNMWWCWNYEAVNLFSKLDRETWESTHHNPVKMLGVISQEKLDRAAADRSYLHAVSAVHAQMMEDIQRPRSWYSENSATLLKSAAGRERPFRVAYFCAEFGITECFQIYSGGLGCLAGDHLKSASELGIPLVAVGLMYQQGYFHQYLNQDGWQQETYPDLDPHNQPIELIRTEGNKPLMVSVTMQNRTVYARIWRCRVGQVPLYLLDTNVELNSREDRAITQRLYGGDHEMRIKQEIILGIGGVRALRALGEDPSVCHINEGHAAFISIERIGEIRRKNPTMTFDEAREAIAASQIFTTHTPVPAGIDRFDTKLIESYLPPYLSDLGLNMEGILALGRENVFDVNERFSMAVLAIRTSRSCNGVSALHGVVSRDMWKHMWPNTPTPDVPIGHVTNGVHGRSWTSPEMIRLFDRYLSDSWRNSPHEVKTWDNLDSIPDQELWDAHVARRVKLVDYVRERLAEQLKGRGAPAAEIERARGALDASALTIGFARRFATYKRGTLLFRDLERLKRIIAKADMPVQVIIAGKSHPADGGGKSLIRDIINIVRQNNLGHRVVFLEDYDIQIARRMIQGCDIWLNTPIRGLEASGTSGMKAALNGVLNCSILDGWWDEGFGPELGFAIGRGEDYDGASAEERDDLESRALYQTIESQVVPEFYDRGGNGLPRKWVARMRRCIKVLSPAFNTHRMVSDYATQYYFPAHAAASRLIAGNYKESIDLAHHVQRYQQHWHEVSVASVKAASDGQRAVTVRQKVKVTANVRLGELLPIEVKVQLYYGQINAVGELINAIAVDMVHDAKASAAALAAGESGGAVSVFTGNFAPEGTGQYGYSVRIVPNDDRMVSPFVPGLITWDTGMPQTAEQLVAV